MLDIKLLRKDPQQVAQLLATRGCTLDLEAFLALEAQRKALQVELQSQQALRNKLSKSIGLARKADDAEQAETLSAQVLSVKQQLEACQLDLEQVRQSLEALLAQLPNLPDPTTPVGTSEADNVVKAQHGCIKEFAFPPLDHVALGANLTACQALDFSTASELSGSRFTVMRGELARLHRALAQFMLDIHTQEHGYQEVYVPYLVYDTTLFGTGQLPKFADDLFKVERADAQPLYLIPTAEVPVTNLVKDQIIPSKDLPLKYVTHTPCFRAEAGSHGRDTRGMIRQHQFEKVELVQIVSPDQAQHALEEITQHAEKILSDLKLPYQKVALCSQDLGFSACKTYDLEVWLPSQGHYREISSCSLCADFQARRLQARFRASPKSIQLVNTLNGSALAIGRTLVALLENHQQPDGSVAIPERLRPYMNGRSILHPRSG